MDALREWIWSDLEVIMAGPWMLCGSGYDLIWTLSWLAHGCSAERIWSDLDVTTVGTRMLCGNGYGLIWTLSWQAHGCSAGVDMV